ncbi:MAG TPA: hypothetical protein DD491_03430 [Halieaceae bacterium]|nr:hypothetical protein [Halieaceae bacterium]
MAADAGLAAHPPGAGDPALAADDGLAADPPRRFHERRPDDQRLAADHSRARHPGKALHARPVHDPCGAIDDRAPGHPGLRVHPGGITHPAVALLAQVILALQPPAEIAAPDPRHIAQGPDLAQGPSIDLAAARRQFVLLVCAVVVHRLGPHASA